ncbi:MAG TPA: peptide ABC transporter substrate-binding protein [Ktedonobacteraceae bacterium]|nr:peptide ABC transporter substrate-binding protein [Ktedonobacteraceae bacterium]
MRSSKKAGMTFIASLLCLLAMLVSACGSVASPQGSGVSNAQPASADKQTFRWPVPGQADFTSLDPALIQDASDNNAVQTIFTGLVQFDDKGNVKDQLAASHSLSPDGTTYTFTLRPNLKFSDGTVLTANDVAYSINRTLQPATQSPVTNYLNLLKDYDKMITGKISTLIGDSLIVKDPQTISIVISKPQAYFLQTLTYPTSYVVEKKLIDKYGKSWTDHLTEGGGDGPFKVASYSHTVGLDLVPNSNYYGNKPKLAKIEMHISGDVNTTYKAYLSHQYDWAAVPTTLLASAKQRPDYIRAPALVIRMVQLNYTVKPFDILKIRQAFDVALNRDLIATNLLRGVVTPTHRYIPVGMYGANPQEVKGPDGTTGTSGNSALAKQLLQQGLQDGGYSSIDKLPPIVITVSNAPNSLAVVNALTDQWKSVLGVTVRTNPVDPNKYDSIYGAGNLQMWYYGWQADYPDPHDWLAIFFGKGQDYNNMHYGQNNTTMAAEQQAVQDQIVKADTITDPAARAQTYNEIELKLASETAWIPLYQSSANVLQSPKLHGFVNDPLGIIDPEDWNNIYMLA